MKYDLPLLLDKSESDMLKLINEFTVQDEMATDYIRVLCFDPGGVELACDY